MTTASIKITWKGQVRDAAGSLREYARNVKPGVSMKQMKDKAWEVAVREKTGKKSSSRMK